MSLPMNPKQVVLAFVAVLAMMASVVGVGLASASAATAPPAGKGHVVITFACDGKIGLSIQGFNDVEGSDPISFVLTDNTTNQVVAQVTDVPYGTYRTSGISLDFGEAYDITATGPGGYSERFHGTFSCAFETVTATPPVFTDAPGDADTYTVPSKVGVEYSVDGVVTAAGTYPAAVVNADGTWPGTEVTVTAAAEPGYVLEGTSTWTHDFTPSGIWTAHFVVTQPSCETMKLSFDYLSGPGEWEVLRMNLPYASGSDYVQIASGSVSNVTGHVSDIVVTGQPAGTYDVAILPLGEQKIDEHAKVTIDACDTPPTSVTPTAPTFTDKAGTADDTYTVPSKVGVEYSVGDVVKPAGTYPGMGTVTVTAGAKPGYVIEGTATWTYTFTSPPATSNPIEATDFVVTRTSCETVTASFDFTGGPGPYVIVRSSDGSPVYEGDVPTATGTVSGLIISGQPAGLETYRLYNKDGGKPITTGVEVTIDACVTAPTSVTPTAPTFTDKVGTADDSYTVPSKAGVEYSVGGVVTAAGTNPGSGTVTVTAGAKPGYVLAGTTTWTFEFTDGAAAASVTPTAPTFTDKVGTADDSYTVPSKAGVEYSVGGVVTAAGTYPGRGSVTVTAGAKPGYVLAGTTTWTFQFTDVVPPTPTPSPSVTVAGVVASASSGGQTALNPGFGAKTGWVAPISTWNGSALGGVLLLTIAGLSGLAFYLRRRTGEQ